MATKTINRKRYQITQVTGTQTGSISIVTSRGLQLKNYRRRFGKVGDWCVRQSLKIGGIKHGNEK